jgi:hypothetical protein
MTGEGDTLVEKHKRRLWPFDFGDRFGRRQNFGRRSAR